MTTEARLKAKLHCRQREKEQAVEDRIVGILVRKGVPLRDIKTTLNKIARRGQQLADSRTPPDLRFSDIKIIIRLVLKEPRMSFDPSTVDAQTAALVARADFEQFTMTTGPNAVGLLNAGHPYQAQFPLNTSQPMSVISWTAVYRGLPLMQPPLIVNTLQLDLGQAAVLDAASKVFDVADLHAEQQGANPNTYAPSGHGP